jgi:hypothetical protein
LKEDTATLERRGPPLEDAREHSAPTPPGNGPLAGAKSGESLPDDSEGGRARVDQLRFDLGSGLPDAAGAPAGGHVERGGRAPDVADLAGTGRLEAAGEKPEHESGTEAEKGGGRLE